MHLVQGFEFAILTEKNCLFLFRTEVHKPTFVGYIRFNYKPLYLR